MTNKKVVLITGTSSGFGMLTAARLAASGHHVFATMRQPEKKELLLSELRWRKAQCDAILPLDVTQKDSIEAVMKEIATRHGYLDILINNAGIAVGGFFEDLSDEDIRRQLETNFFGVLNVTRSAIPLMRQNPGAKIINISSVSGFSSYPCLSAYNASKWALEGFSESLRYELKLWNIDVLLVEPGTYKTKIFSENGLRAARFDDEQSPYFQYSQTLDKKMKEGLKDCYKDPEDVARLIERLIDMKNPPFRSIPDFESQILYILRKTFPFRMFSGIVQRTFLKRINAIEKES